MTAMEVVRSDAEVNLAAGLVRGSGDTTVVLLHGLTQQRHFWGPVIERLCVDPTYPPILSVDLRGHGDSDKPDDGPYDVPTCARDVVALLASQSIERAVVVGHSWGAWVAIELAATDPHRIASVVALDGGVQQLAGLGTREEVRERLTPPTLGVPLDELMGMIAGGSLAPWWSDEVSEALLPTFEVGDDGLARTRLGFDRHMLVLDGLLDYNSLDAMPRVQCPAWLVRCEPIAPDEPPSEWTLSAAQALDEATRRLAMPRVQRWSGALHDVPLQWPWLVAGLIREVVADAKGAHPDEGISQ